MEGGVGLGWLKVGWCWCDALGNVHARHWDRTINASPRADTDIDIPVHSIGREEVPAEVVHQTDDMKAAALNTGFVAAKDHYMQKAQKLSKGSVELG